MNRLTLKALLLSVITELKFGVPLANDKAAKSQFKELAGLPKNASNKKVLIALGFTYKDNGIENDFWAVIAKFKAEKYLA